MITTAIINKPGFYEHLREAVEINTQRLPIYAGLSKGASLKLSLRLIFFERLAFLPAKYYDWCAAKFNRQGIPIITNDFVASKGLPSPTLAPLYRHMANAATIQKVQELLLKYKKEVKAQIKQGAFEFAAQISREALTNIKEIETKNGCHFAMCLHLIESIGFGCMNALEFIKLSNGKTLALSKSFLTFQTLALDYAVDLDKRAQALHRLGVGIIVNDVPAIPFT